MTEQEILNFKNIHTPGIRGIFKIYTFRTIGCSIAFIFSISFSILLISILNSSRDFYAKEFLLKLSLNLVGIFPNLLGFNLGCYALIIGLGNSNFISALTKPIKDRPYSLYQKTISIFAFSIIIQALVLLISFCINSFSDSNLSNIETFNNQYNAQLNSILIFILMFLAVWAISLMINLTINVFTYGQLNHFFIKLEEIKMKNTELAAKITDVEKKNSSQKKKKKKR